MESLRFSLELLQNNMMQDLWYLLPELILCGTILAMLAFRLFSRLDRLHMASLALPGLVLALLLAIRFQWSPREPLSQLPQDGWAYRGSLFFGGMVANDSLAVFARIFLIASTLLVTLLTTLTGIPDREDSADFYCLLLGATVGMCLMSSANHLLMIYIGVEMASVPSYALAGFMKGRRQGSEAALKYVVYGGGASGVMLYGISLLAGRFGTAYLPEVAAGMAASFGESARGGALDPVILLATLFILIGIAFKVSAVPFHFWCPDVFEGAPAEVAGFLSVASKGAALVLLGRICMNVAGFDVWSPDKEVWVKSATYLGPVIGFIAILTTTFGNLAAYVQTNIKRLLAYSTIAHAGFMLMGIATFRAEGMSAVLFYLVAYLAMNVGAFAIVAFIRNKTGSEELSSYRGLIQRSPVMTIALSLFLFSLLGLPPLVGFAAKFQIFRVLFDAGQVYAGQAPILSNTMFALLVIGGLNTVVSLFYYVRVVKIMIIESPVEAPEGSLPANWSFPIGSVAYAVVLSIAVLVMGILWDPLANFSAQGMQRFSEAGRLQALPPLKDLDPNIPLPRAGGIRGGP